MARFITNLEQRQRRFGWAASGWFHSAAITALLGCYLAGLDDPKLWSPDEAVRQIFLTATGNLFETEQPATAIEVAGQAATDASSIPVTTVTKEPSRGTSKQVEKPDAADLSSAEAVRSRVEQSIRDARSLDRDEQERRLETLSKRLSEVATVESVGQISDKLQQVLGSEPRATKPAEKKVAGEFDSATAQLHDVRREANDNGGFRYRLVLLDSAGRTLETEVDETEGEGIYKTFALIKSNPLLERLYRGVVMSLLDQILKSDAKPAKPAEDSPASDDPSTKASSR